MACTPTQSTSAHVESGLLRAAVSATFEVDCPACFGRVKPAVRGLCNVARLKCLIFESGEEDRVRPRPFLDVTAVAFPPP